MSGIGVNLGVPSVPILPLARRSTMVVAGSLSILAGLSHLYLIPGHSEVIAIALFFAVVGLSQLGFGAMFLLRRSKRLFRVGMVSSGTLIVLYILTRFVAVPIGHHANPEPIEPFGILVGLVEGSLIIALLRLSGGSGTGNKGTLDASVRERSTISGTNRGDRSYVGYLLLAMLLGGFVLGVLVSQAGLLQTLPKLPSVTAQNIREVTLIVEPKQMKVGDRGWEVWTYNGTVPGPTLKGTVGEILRITLVNKHNLTHSIHTHLRGYKFEMDGSQANIIAGKGASSMVPPNGQYLYEYPLTTPGIYYYHCHSADGGRPIFMHIRMGLYGAIVVDEPDRPPAKEFVVFYSEGQPRSPAPYVINNRGIPGGEHVLEQIFKEKGFPGVAGQLNVTVTAFKVSKGDVVRFHVINIGDLYHSHHHHGFEHRSIRTLGGQGWAAALLPLIPGQADSLEFRATEPGLWLIHCHVVSHADAGMIAVLIVE